MGEHIIVPVYPPVLRRLISLVEETTREGFKLNERMHTPFRGNIGDILCGVHARRTPRTLSQLAQ